MSNHVYWHWYKMFIPLKGSLQLYTYKRHKNTRTYIDDLFNPPTTKYTFRQM